MKLNPGTACGCCDCKVKLTFLGYCNDYMVGAVTLTGPGGTFNGVTDAVGSVTLDTIVSGLYQVTLNVTGYAQAPNTGSPYPTGIPEFGTFTTSLNLVCGTSVTLKVPELYVNIFGGDFANPLAGATCTVSNGTYSVTATTVAGPPGQALIIFPAAGLYDVAFAAAGYMPADYPNTNLTNCSTITIKLDPA